MAISLGRRSFQVFSFFWEIIPSLLQLTRTLHSPVKTEYLDAYTYCRTSTWPSLVTAADGVVLMLPPLLLPFLLKWPRVAWVHDSWLSYRVSYFCTMASTQTAGRSKIQQLPHSPAADSLHMRQVGFNFRRYFFALRCGSNSYRWKKKIFFTNSAATIKQQDLCVHLGFLGMYVF